MKKTSLFLVLLMVCGGLAAQEMEVSSDAIKSDTLKNAVDSLNVTAPVDSLQNAAQKKVVPAVKKKVELPPLEVRNFWRLMQNFRREYNAQLERWDDIYLLITGIRPNPDYYKLSMPATYYEAPIEQAFSISDWKPQIPFIKENVLDAQLPQVADLRHSVQVDKAVNRQLLSFYLSYPSLVKQNEENLKGLKPIYGEVLVNQPRKENLLDMMQNDELPNRVTEKTCWLSSRISGPLVEMVICNSHRTTFRRTGIRVVKVPNHCFPASPGRRIMMTDSVSSLKTRLSGNWALSRHLRIPYTAIRLTMTCFA